MSPHSLEVSDGVADGVNAHVAHMQSSRRVREHGEDIKLLLLVGNLRSAAHTHTHTHRQTDRQTERQTDRQTDRQSQRQR